MSLPSRDQLRAEVVEWIANQVDTLSRDRSVRVEQQAARRTTKRSLPGAVKQKLKDVAGLKPPAPAATFLRVDRYTIRGHASRLETEALSSRPSTEMLGSPSRVASDLCCVLRAPAATALTTAWFECGRLEEGDGVMDSENLALLIGAAAAAVVVTIVLLVRCGREVRPSHRRQVIAPSEDFSSLLEVAADDDEAGAAARTLRDRADEPWNWKLSDEIRALEEDARRALLRRLAALERGGVRSVQPVEGSRFDPNLMRASITTNDDDVWVVAETSAAGFKIGERVAEKARVRIATWDSRVLLDERCPVGRLLRERAEDLVPGGAAGRDTWRATWGLSHPEDLRELVDEASLETWRDRMVDGVNAAYPAREGRQLVLTGQKGAVFEASTMEAEGEAPIGDALVEMVVIRDGVPQHGLACPGGSPLLLAVVKATASVTS